MSGLATAAWGRLALVAVCVVTLAGCASQSGNRAVALESPLLALPPNALGCAAQVQQRLTVLPPGQAARELDALLEVDASTVRLAILNLGQMVGTLEWDGRQLRTELSRWWPGVLAPEQVLSDLQMAFWPQEAIVQALPARWTLRVSSQRRTLLFEGSERASVVSRSADALEIIYPQGPWSLRIDTPGGPDLCSNGTRLQ